MIQVQPDNTVTHGIDISSFQTDVNWTQVKASGNQFAFIKSSEGISLRDPFFASHWKGATDASLLRAPYHFFHPALDPIAQAKLMISQVPTEKLAIDLPWVLDIEWTDGFKVLGSTGATNAMAFLDHIETYTGMTPIIYTSAYFFQAIPSPALFARYPLWIAAYQVKAPTVPAPWHTFSFWQYTDHAAIPGVGRIDSNLFNGSLPSLKTLARKL